MADKKNGKKIVAGIFVALAACAITAGVTTGFLTKSNLSKYFNDLIYKIKNPDNNDINNATKQYKVSCLYFLDNVQDDSLTKSFTIDSGKSFDGITYKVPIEDYTFKALSGATLGVNNVDKDYHVSYYYTHDVTTKKITLNYFKDNQVDSTLTEVITSDVGSQFNFNDHVKTINGFDYLTSSMDVTVGDNNMVVNYYYTTHIEIIPTVYTLTCEYYLDNVVQASDTQNISLNEGQTFLGLTYQNIDKYNANYLFSNVEGGVLGTNTMTGNRTMKFYFITRYEPAVQTTITFRYYKDGVLDDSLSEVTSFNAGSSIDYDARKKVIEGYDYNKCTLVVPDSGSPSFGINYYYTQIHQTFKVEGVGASDPSTMKSFIGQNGSNYVETSYTLTGTKSNGTYKTAFDDIFYFPRVYQDGNVFVKIPKFYKKITQITDGQITAFEMSRYKINDDYKPYPCFIKPDMTESDYVLYGAYKGYSDGTKLTSVSDKAATASVNIINFRTQAKANGDGYALTDVWTRQLMIDLFEVTFHTCRYQDIFNGKSGSSMNTGFSNASTAKCSVIDSRINFFGIEDLILNNWEFLDGFTLYNGKGYVCYDYTKYICDDITNYSLVSSTLPTAANGYIVKLGYDSSNPFINLPTAFGGTDSTYYQNCAWISNTGYRIMLWGGEIAGGPRGLGSVSLDEASSFAHGALSARLVYHPIA